MYSLQKIPKNVQQINHRFSVNSSLLCGVTLTLSPLPSNFFKPAHINNNHGLSNSTFSKHG